jgi:hypothetical protein
VQFTHLDFVGFAWSASALRMKVEILQAKSKTIMELREVPDCNLHSVADVHLRP